ncbi:MAG: RNA polymerase sigma factor [bacterium]
MTDHAYEVGSTSESLIGRLKSQEEDAWERFVDLYGPMIYFWCRYCRVSPDDAADLSQEVFRSVVTGVDNFRYQRDGDTFRGWLWTITRNTVRDAARGGQLSAEGQGGTDMQLFLQQIAENEAESGSVSSEVPGVSLLVRRALEAIRGDFNEQTWNAFRLTVFEGCSSSVAAQELGMNANAVRKAKARVLLRLREELGDFST